METALGVERSLTGRRWVWRPGDARLGAALSQRLGLPELVGRLLAARGVGLEAAEDFLRPTLRALLPDPSVLRDMDAAAARLADAVERVEQVAVFADYDVDGACAGAIMVLVLRALGARVTHYVPDRLAEGYGPNAPAILRLVEGGASLVVCVDCGIAAHEALGAAAGRADVVVLDHHLAEGPPPAVAAAVNPNRPDCPSGLGALCAAGVAFLAAVAMQRELRRRGFFAGRTEPDLRRLLDLVALATVCDVVPLLGVNRAFVAQGLRVLAARERPGLNALLEVAGAREAPSPHTLGFQLGPRINAGGRISAPDLGLRLLIEEDPLEARALAERLDRVNRERQEIEGAVLAAAMAQAEAQAEAGRAVLLAAGEGWHPGVIGIVAGRIKERFNRPACVAALAEGLAKGSGRSVPGLDLGAAVLAARRAGLLVAGGGHAMAAGFAAETVRLAAVHAHLEERLAAARALPRQAALLIDGALEVGAATPALAERIAALGPFGAAHEEPLLVLRGARVVHAARVGREGRTVRAVLEGEGGGRLTALCFRGGEGPLGEALLRPDGAALHLCGALRFEERQGRAEARLFVQDLAHAL